MALVFFFIRFYIMSMSDNNDINEESFAELFEQSVIENDYLEPGQAVDTEIVAISGDSIFLHLNGKSEGVLDAEEMTDDEGNLTVKEGDSIKVYFLKADKGEMRFTTRISSSEAGLAVLQSAFEEGTPVEGVVEKEIKGGFSVKIGESRAFCPFSQMGERRVEDSSEWIGKHLTFKITEHSEKGRNIIVSNRAIIEEEKAKKRDELMGTLKEGMVLKAKIVSLRDFGAFVDLGGVQALLPISEISLERVNNVEDVLSVGQEVEGKILNLDWDSNRISFSLKAMKGDPWDGAVQKYKVGAVHTGKIARVTDFGAFVNLEPGLDGLIHVSELAGNGRNVRPRDVVKTGEEVQVKILQVDAEKKRLSLKQMGEGQEDTDYTSYTQSSGDDSGETYNPFAALLKDRNKK